MSCLKLGGCGYLLVRLLVVVLCCASTGSGAWMCDHSSKDRHCLGLLACLLCVYRL